jgi:hypothetical protein
MALSTFETSELRNAKSLLENPGLAARISNYIGSPIEATLKRLPESVNAKINSVAKTSIEKTLDIAILTMDKGESSPHSNWWHKVAAGASGAVGGAFGLPALAIELPVSTTIMLRSIADIARSEGEDLACPNARLQCVQVLALGGNAKSDDGMESSYFATRAALAKAVSEAATHLAKKGLSQNGAPALVRLVTQVAARFSVVVSEKAAVQAVPLVGAIGGAAINALFIDHFQDMGRGHFVVRRLERLHGQDVVRQVYESL